MSWRIRPSVLQDRQATGLWPRGLEQTPPSAYECKEAAHTVLCVSLCSVQGASKGIVEPTGPMPGQSEMHNCIVKNVRIS